MDVEELNESALQGKFDITKLSYAAYFAVREKYDLLQVGSALGRNCGPILIYPSTTQPPTPLNHCKVLSPGKMTTARLLLDLYLKSHRPNEDFSIQIEERRYDQVIPGLENGEGDLGLIIHEERFTYKDRGMESYLDLGEWWEKETGLPIPLGCIAIKRELSQNWKLRLESCLQRSLDLAWENPNLPMSYILKHSQNKNPQVVQSHIQLYVNEFTRDLGEEGNRAIQELTFRYKSINDPSNRG